MVVDVLKVQPGDNLTEILYTPATPEQVTLKLAIIVYGIDKTNTVLQHGTLSRQSIVQSKLLNEANVNLREEYQGVITLKTAL